MQESQDGVYLIGYFCSRLTAPLTTWSVDITVVVRILEFDSTTERARMLQRRGGWIISSYEDSTDFELLSFGRIIVVGAVSWIIEQLSLLGRLRRAQRSTLDIASYDKQSYKLACAGMRERFLERVSPFHNTWLQHFTVDVGDKSSVTKGARRRISNKTADGHATTHRT